MADAVTFGQSQGMPAMPPDGWERAIADPIAKRFGHTIRLASSSNCPPEDGDFLDVFVDDELSGSILVFWDDSSARDQLLRELREQIEELCAQELGRGLD